MFVLRKWNFAGEVYPLQASEKQPVQMRKEQSKSTTGSASVHRKQRPTVQSIFNFLVCMFENTRITLLAPKDDGIFIYCKILQKIYLKKKTKNTLT